MAEYTHSPLPQSQVLYSPDAIDLEAAYDETAVAGKTILITGGASGIGEAMFRRFAALGAVVVVGDVDAGRGVNTVAETRKLTNNPNLHFVHLDVTSYASQCAFFQTSLSLSPSRQINSVIANAGVTEYGSLLPDTAPYDPSTSPPEPTLTTLDVNLKGVIYTVRLALYHLRSSASDRSLILLGSMSSFISGPGIAAVYSSSKHGVLGLFRSLRLFPSKRDNIRINLICPYFVDTPILPASGKILLAGVELAEVADVVEAAAKMVCDVGIAGRCLVVAPRCIGGILEVGTEEMEDAEAFTRRVVRLLNVQEKGIFEVLKVVLNLFCLEPVVRAFRG